MISEKLQEAINGQITAEMWSSNLYLSMYFHLEHAGYPGCAHWMKAQADEELDHAHKMADYLLKRGGQPRVSAIEAVPTTWESPARIFDAVLAHERHVSDLINRVYEQAVAEKDYATQDFFMSFVREQVEEEATAQSIVDMFSQCGCSGCMMKIDSRLGKR